MPNEQRDNSGVLFKNDRKEQDSHPDYKGWGMVAGTEVWISAWIKSGAKGKFMSLAIKAKDAPREERKPTRPDRTAHGLQDDEPLPF